MRLTNKGHIILNPTIADEACLLHRRDIKLTPHMGSSRRGRNLRIRILSEQQNHRCCYCGVRTWCRQHEKEGSLDMLATVEHIVPKSQGGPLSMDNLVMACHKCNRRRGDANAYIFLLERNGKLKFGLKPLMINNTEVRTNR
jgi:5-methylcytosine-specific restriction endonuclease McrA